MKFYEPQYLSNFKDHSWLDEYMVRFFINTFKSYKLKRFDKFKQRYVLILDLLFLELVILKFLVKRTQKYDINEHIFKI